MTVRYTTTDDVQGKCKVIVYGTSGIGKTTLCKTAPNPVIISGEKRNISLRKFRIPVAEVSSTDDINQVYDMLTTTAQGQAFSTICIDSLSDIAGTVLANHKLINTNIQRAYGQMADEILPLIKKFRDLDRDVYMIAQQSRIKDDFSGITSFGPSMPGQALDKELPYLFDEVLCMREMKDTEGNLFRVLQTQPDMQYMCKDASGVLDMYEYPDLTNIFNKMRGT